MFDKKIAVAIPVYKPDLKALEKQIDMILSQSVKPYEILILHTDMGENLENIKKLSCVKYIKIYPKDFDHGGTRDIAIRYSASDYVIFLTQDAEVFDDLLIENLIKPFEKKNVAITYGRQIASKNSSLIEKYSRLFNYPKEDKIKTKGDISTLGIKTFFCSDVCSCYDKKKYILLGGFQKHIIFNEDMIFAYTAIMNDYIVYYASNAKVFHSHDYTFRKQFKRNFDLGVSQTDYSYIFKNISSVSEGGKYSKSIIFKLLKQYKFNLAIKFVMLCAFKYLGYKFGRSYKKLPRKMVLKFSDNINYWS